MLRNLVVVPLALSVVGCDTRQPAQMESDANMSTESLAVENLTVEEYSSPGEPDNETVNLTRPPKKP